MAFRPYAEFLLCAESRTFRRNVRFQKADFTIKIVVNGNGFWVFEPNESMQPYLSARSMASSTRSGVALNHSVALKVRPSGPVTLSATW